MSGCWELAREEGSSVSRQNVVLLTVTGFVALFSVIFSIYWFLGRALLTPEDIGGDTTEVPAEPETPPESAPEEETGRRIRVTLYLLSGTGTSLVTEEREIHFFESPQEQAKQIVSQLLAGSQRGRSSPFPRGVRLRDLFITSQGLAFVDLSKELISNHPGGVSAEELTVYSLANTLISNLPTVKKVQILVEGREVPSLAGHLDLSIPYGRGPTWFEQIPQSSSGP